MLDVSMCTNHRGLIYSRLLFIRETQKVIKEVTTTFLGVFVDTADIYH